MDISPQQRDARSFVVWGVVATLGLFGILRLPWVEANILLPLTRAQGAMAVALFGTPALPVQITLACSGADTLALCVGAVLAYPVPWSARAIGVALGMALILIVNTLRIGTLGLVITSPVLFDALHLYVWPAALTLAVAAYVFTWMRAAEAGPTPREAGAVKPAASIEPAPWRPSRRFLVLAAVFLTLFVMASGTLLESSWVLTLGAVITRAAAVVLTGAGVAAQSAGNVLITTRGAFVVTQECVSTPIMPLYLAAVCAYAPDRRRLGIGLLATLPLIVGLGILRLLLVAVPPALVDSPTFLVHAFYQLLLGAVLVVLAGIWRHGRRAAPVYAIAGLTVGVLFVVLAGTTYTASLMPASSVALDDPQGAVAFLPAFQVGLYLALIIAAAHTVRWPRLAAGLVLLVLSQLVGLVMLHSLAISGVVAQVRDIRAWAVAAPVVIFAAMVHRAQPTR